MSDNEHKFTSAGTNRDKMDLHQFADVPSLEEDWKGRDRKGGLEKGELALNPVRHFSPPILVGPGPTATHDQAIVLARQSMKNEQLHITIPKHRTRDDESRRFKWSPSEGMILLEPSESLEAPVNPNELIGDFDDSKLIPICPVEPIPYNHLYANLGNIGTVTRQRSMPGCGNKAAAKKRRKQQKAARKKNR